MDILVFADLHHWSEEELLSCLSNNNYDGCILLGDIDDEALAFIKTNIIWNKTVRCCRKS